MPLTPARPVALLAPSSATTTAMLLLSPTASIRISKMAPSARAGALAALLRRRLFPAFS